jgi:predicted transposase/invertase (TIGR01784 family)
MGISRDEAERFRLLGEHKRELDLQSGFVEAERAGERKGALEIARKLKKRNIPAEQIAEDTGLSIDEIAGL